MLTFTVSADKVEKIAARYGTQIELGADYAETIVVTPDGKVRYRCPLQPMGGAA